MAFDFEKLKQKLSVQNIKEMFASNKAQTPAAAPAKTGTAASQVEQFKQGLQDIKAVAQEGNYKLFVKQLVVVLLVFLGVRYIGGKLADQKAGLADKISAISIQQTNQEDYLANKDRLLRLEPLFPDVAKKNDWLLRQIKEIFEAHKMQVDIDGNITEKAENNYTAVSQTATFQQSFNEVGKLMADIENGDEFVRISELTLTKATDPNLLGLNTINVKFNTLFPKEKYGPRLFKDYAKQMQQIKGETTPAQEAK